MGRPTHHISAECSRDPRDWACADIGTPSMTCVTLIAGELSTHITNFSTILPAAPEIRKRGTHVRTCRCTAPLAVLAA